jgi:chorismate synthase
LLDRIEDGENLIAAIGDLPEREYSFVDVVNVRCPVIETGVLMIENILRVKDLNDSVGGTATCVIKRVPVGLGEPCFEKTEAMLAMAMMSIPATKGFEIGSGFEGTKMLGSAHNDPFHYPEESNETKDKAPTLSLSLSPDLAQKSNNSGGTLGGITHGGDIIFRVAVKPTSSISLSQETCTYIGTPTSLEAKGRHDPCVLPRIIPIVETQTASVLMDLALQQLARKEGALVYLEKFGEE